MPSERERGGRDGRRRYGVQNSGIRDQEEDRMTEEAAPEAETLLVTG